MGFSGIDSANKMVEFIHKCGFASSKSLLLKGNRVQLKLLESGCERLWGRMVSLSKAKLRNITASKACPAPGVA